MDGSPVCNDRARIGSERWFSVGARRGSRLRGNDSQYPNGKNAEGCADCLRTKWRGFATGTRISAASAFAGLRGQYAHQMAAPHGSQRQTVYDAGTNFQIYRFVGPP